MPRPTEPLGTVVVNEETCFISRIQLQAGRIWFHAESIIRKTEPEVWAEDFVVFAPDGTVIMVAKSPTLITERQDGHLVVMLPVKLTSGTPGEDPARPPRDKP